MMKKILDSALLALLKGLELSPWVKVPATFIAELSKRFQELPEEQQKGIVEASAEQIKEALDENEFEVENSEQLAKVIYEEFRMKVHQYLNKLAAPDIDRIVAAINGASGRVTKDAPPLRKAAELLEFVEAPNGPGLYEVAKRLEGF